MSDLLGDDDFPLHFGMNEADRENFARQIRILAAAGKSPLELREQLREAGCPDADAEEILAEFHQLSNGGARTQKWGRRGALLGVAFSIAATAVFQPWNITWRTRSGRILDDFEAVGLYWCGGLLALTAICWFLGSMFGSMLEAMNERKKP